MFALRIKQLRKEMKKTQADMAEIIGVSRPAYTAYELGNREPDYQTLERLAEIFGVTVDYLLGKSDSKSLTADGYTLKEEKDMKKRIDKIKEDLLNGNADGLLFDGEPMSEETIESIISAMEYAEKQATLINRKYTPKKYRKDIDSE